MPVYEYNCLNCNLKFEYLLRSIQESVFCPRCKSKGLKRLISVFAFSSKDAYGNVTGSSSGCSSCTSFNCSACGQ